MTSPPQYEQTNPLLAQEPADEIPDDFKYSTSVAQCTVDIRHLFLRKVYTLLSVQLAATAGVAEFISTHATVQHWALSNMWAFFLAMVASVVFMIVAFLKQRSYPLNLALLGAFTLCESYTVGVITCLYDTKAVLSALLITLAVFVGLTLFAAQTKYDFSSWYTYLGAAVWCLIGVSMVALFVPTSSSFELIYSSVAAIIFCGYILVDTHAVMNRFHPEDEVSAAIALYLDVINLFINLLRILHSEEQ